MNHKETSIDIIIMSSYKFRELYNGDILHCQQYKTVYKKKHSEKSVKDDMQWWYNNFA